MWFRLELEINCRNRAEADENVEHLLEYYEGPGEFYLVSVREKE